MLLNNSSLMTRELVVGPNYVNSRLLFLLLSIFGPFLSFDEMQAGVDGFKREVTFGGIDSGGRRTEHSVSN